LFWRHAKALLVIFSALVFGASLTPALNGCAGDQPGAERVAQAIGVDPYRLDEDGARELARFNHIYTIYADDPADIRELKQFRDVYKRIRANYVTPVSDRHLIDAAVKAVVDGEAKPGSVPSSRLVDRALEAMTASLDPHSAYLDPEALKESELVTTGEFGGLGIQVTQDGDKIKVISPIEGTPAERAGVQPGDLITHLDRKAITGMSLRDAVHAMRGAPGTPILLTLKRGEQPPFDVSITRDVIAIQPVRWSVENDIGYVRVASFNEKTADALDEALDEIRKQPSVRGLVLDLRNNPGGLLDQSLAVADAFLDDGVIVSIRGREKGTGRAFQASKGDMARGWPMVVLINAGSASASEIVAAALQDHGRAIVMGARSFGKGSVQTVLRLPQEGALKLTTALYYAPNGETIQARGVEPNIRLSGAEEAGEDAHEADLPGALPAQGPAVHVETQGSVDARACPIVGKARDREVGCAVAYLQAGSPERFVASMERRSAL
jgi:carboxyl-terminal processing protease